MMQRRTPGLADPPDDIAVVQLAQHGNLPNGNARVLFGEKVRYDQRNG